MVIEWLRFKVKPGIREQFIASDRQIWTAALSPCPGFLRKSVWVNPKQENEVIIVIEWATREDWSNVPQALLDETEQRFAEAVGADNYEYDDRREYQLRDR